MSKKLYSVVLVLFFARGFASISTVVTEPGGATQSGSISRLTINHGKEISDTVSPEIWKKLPRTSVKVPAEDRREMTYEGSRWRNCSRSSKHRSANNRAERCWESMCLSRPPTAVEGYFPSPKSILNRLCKW